MLRYGFRVKSGDFVLEHGESIWGSDICEAISCSFLILKLNVLVPRSEVIRDIHHREKWPVACWGGTLVPAPRTRWGRKWHLMYVTVECCFSWIQVKHSAALVLRYIPCSLQAESIFISKLVFPSEYCSSSFLTLWVWVQGNSVPSLVWRLLCLTTCLGCRGRSSLALGWVLFSKSCYLITV